jgi:Met-zincin
VIRLQDIFRSDVLNLLYPALILWDSNDYPEAHPHFSSPFEPGNLALNDRAYSQGIGGFDKVAIDYGYRIFKEDDENPLLIKLIDDAESNGYSFLNDQVSPALPSPTHCV